jgi:hypothetical protein
MTKLDALRMAASGLLTLVGAALTFASIQLWDGKAASWPDIVADDLTVKITAKAILVVAVILLGAAAAIALDLAWAKPLSILGALLFVAGGFWANSTLFGGIRPLHTGTNVVIGAFIIWLVALI